MRNDLLACMAWAAIIAACPGVSAQPAPAPTPPATPVQPATPKAPGALPESEPAPVPAATQSQSAARADDTSAAPAASAATPAAPGTTPSDAAASPELAAVEPAPPAATGPAVPAPADDAAAAPSASPAAPAAIAEAAAVPRASCRRPAEFPFAVYLNIEPQWNTDTGYDLFDDDDVSTEVGLGVSYDAVEIVPNVALVVELAWGMSSQEQDMLFGGALSATELETHRLSAAVGAHYRMVPWIGPHARIAAGLSLFDAGFEGSSFEERFEDSGTSPFLRLGVGVSAEQSIGSRIAAGALIEGGYTLAKGAALALEPGNDSGGISTDYAELGTLSLSGPYLRMSALVRF